MVTYDYHANYVSSQLNWINVVLSKNCSKGNEYAKFHTMFILNHDG